MTPMPPSSQHPLNTPGRRAWLTAQALALVRFVAGLIGAVAVTALLESNVSGVALSMPTASLTPVLVASWGAYFALKPLIRLADRRAADWTISAPVTVDLTDPDSVEVARARLAVQRWNPAPTWAATAARAVLVALLVGAAFITGVVPATWGGVVALVCEIGVLLPFPFGVYRALGDVRAEREDVRAGLVDRVSWATAALHLRPLVPYAACLAAIGLLWGPLGLSDPAPGLTGAILTVTPFLAVLLLIFRACLNLPRLSLPMTATPGQ